MQLTYPIAEIFESIQGEGGQAGIPMTFLRLAGCNVGKPYTAQAKAELALEPFQERCTSWDGTSWPCDTNYRRSKQLSIAEIIALPEIKDADWISLTGGEPLMHAVDGLVRALLAAKKKVHIETSGTKAYTLPDLFTVMPDLFTVMPDIWLTVSPKIAYLPFMLDQADEIRVMVDKDFDVAAFTKAFAKWFDKLWLSPVNNLMTLDLNNVQKCVAIVQKYKQLRITTQMHKVWGLR